MPKKYFQWCLFVKIRGHFCIFPSFYGSHEILIWLQMWLFYWELSYILLGMVHLASLNHHQSQAHHVVSHALVILQLLRRHLVLQTFRLFILFILYAKSKYRMQEALSGPDQHQQLILLSYSAFFMNL